MKKIQLFLLAALVLLAPVLRAEGAFNPTEMTVYRSPTCGCCGKWIEHVKQNRFNVKDIVSDDMQVIKQKLGVPAELSSCHTATIGGYVIEGHVPAGDIQRLLETKPNVVGIAAPGMPMGSPGMEMGDKKDTYQVISFDKEGKTQIFQTHGDKH